MHGGIDARDWHLGILDLEVTAWFEEDEGAGYDLTVVAETAEERPSVDVIEFCVLSQGASTSAISKRQLGGTLRVLL